MLNISKICPLRTLVHQNPWNFLSNPSFNIDVDVKSKALNDHGKNIFEFELLSKEKQKLRKTLFLIEGSYCGIFTIENAESDVLEKFF